MVMPEGVLGRRAALDPAVRIALDRGMGREPIGHVAALVAARVARSRVALVRRMVCVARRVIAFTRLAAAVGSDVGAIFAVIAIDANRLRTELE